MLPASVTGSSSFPAARGCKNSKSVTGSEPRRPGHGIRPNSAAAARSPEGDLLAPRRPCPGGHGWVSDRPVEVGVGIGVDPVALRCVEPGEPATESAAFYRGHVPDQMVLRGYWRPGRRPGHRSGITGTRARGLYGRGTRARSVTLAMPASRSTRRAPPPEGSPHAHSHRRTGKQRRHRTPRRGSRRLRAGLLIHDAAPRPRPGQAGPSPARGRSPGKRPSEVFVLEASPHGGRRGTRMNIIRGDRKNAEAEPTDGVGGGALGLAQLPWRPRRHSRPVQHRWVSRPRVGRHRSAAGQRSGVRR